MHWLALTPDARGFTLMNPLGGAPARYDDRAESIRAAAGYIEPLVREIVLDQAAALARG